MNDGQPGAFAPLRQRVFAVLWAATVIGNLGTWMRDVGSGWLMVTLSPSATVVALVQAATSLPIFLLALPAGALADLLDRRRMLIAVQAALLVVVSLMAALAAADALTPWSLLALTFLAGCFAALGQPAWQAVVPELVPKPLLRPAVALNSLGLNISRAIGPALGGLIVATHGVPAAYAADALTYAVVIAALLWWRRDLPALSAPPERLGGAMRSGVRYALRAPPLRRVLLRAVLFFAPASASWALLPLLARGLPDAGPAGYGMMLAAIGAGAVGGALALPAIRARLAADATLLGATATVAAAMPLLAISASVAFAVAASALLGLGWIVAVTTLNVAAQGVLPAWVRARGLALYLTAFYGAMAAGSVGWGRLADAASVPLTLAAAAALAIALALLARRLPLPDAPADLAPAGLWPEPATANPVPGERGPVVVSITYRIDASDREAFGVAIAPLRDIRLRDGALRWGLMEDAADPGTVVEWFELATWDEHLRQHARLTAADVAVQQRVRGFHRGDGPPAVTHLVSVA
ncbi:MFS transporter [Elioraea rosea]|uniref:MFS transporter n=1 Tax=Elioraea rosea TaxID=2492390 RepID=UPI001183ECCE|nr:MFS transporter [Elioraea rosea]